MITALPFISTILFAAMISAPFFVVPFSFSIGTGGYTMRIARLVLIMAVCVHFGCANKPARNKVVYKDQATIAAEKEKMDLRDWELAEKENSSESYRRYLRNPSGKFAETTRQRIEEKKWGLAVGMNSTQSYERYLSEYPAGAHSQTAQDLLAKTPSVIGSVDQTNQKGKKIDNWGYIFSLINFAKANLDDEIAKEALEYVFILLEENFPSDSFNGSHQGTEFKSRFLKSLKEEAPFIVAFAPKRQKNGSMRACVQELGGYEVPIDHVSLNWRGNQCHGSTWTHQRWNTVKISPYGNTWISSFYSIPCGSFSSFSMEISSKKDRIFVSTTVE